jgi:hypothetical protein
MLALVRYDKTMEIFSFLIVFRNKLNFFIGFPVNPIYLMELLIIKSRFAESILLPHQQINKTLIFFSTSNFDRVKACFSAPPVKSVLQKIKMEGI